MEDKAPVEDSDNKTKEDNSHVENECSEVEKMDSSKDDDRIDDSHKSKNDDDSIDDSQQSTHDDKVTCLPVLTYLDEACSRCRINNMALTLMNKVEEGGRNLLNKIYDTAQRHDKERLIRILNDIHAGKIVTRAQSRKVLEAQDT